MVAGSGDKETMVTHKKPAKVTHHLIQAACTIKAVQTKVSKAVKAPAASIPTPTGKHKLKWEGV